MKNKHDVVASKVIVEEHQERVNAKWPSHIEWLVQLGNMLKPSVEEGSDMGWLSTKCNLPLGLLILVQFLMYYQRQFETIRKNTDEKCCLCGNKGTLHLVLNFCPISLTHWRYTDRYNAIIQHLTKYLKNLAESILI